jgi:hypothetical protein
MVLYTYYNVVISHFYTMGTCTQKGLMIGSSNKFEGMSCLTHSKVIL